MWNGNIWCDVLKNVRKLQQKKCPSMSKSIINTLNINLLLLAAPLGVAKRRRCASMSLYPCHPVTPTPCMWELVSLWSSSFWLPGNSILNSHCPIYPQFFHNLNMSKHFNIALKPAQSKLSLIIPIIFLVPLTYSKTIFNPELKLTLIMSITSG